METHCTCGAPVPPDARFCPQCARPLYEEPAPEQAEPDADEIAESSSEQSPQQDAPPPIAFSNALAVRSAWPAALLASLLNNLPFLSFLCFLWWPGAGFLAVYRYRRRTGLTPTVAEGAKLGWITGVLTFCVSLFVLALVSLVSGEGGFSELIRGQLLQAVGDEEMRRQMSELLKSSTFVAFLVLFSLLMQFMITVGFTAAGGALCAKVLDKD